MTCQIAIAPDAPRTEALAAALTTDSIFVGTELRDVIALFRARPDLEALPVVDDADRPLGAVLEREVRKLLLNPYGHALLQNDTLYRRLDTFLSAVPVADIGAGLG